MATKTTNSGKDCGTKTKKKNNEFKLQRTRQINMTMTVVCCCVKKTSYPIIIISFILYSLRYETKSQLSMSKLSQNSNNKCSHYYRWIISSILLLVIVQNNHEWISEAMLKETVQLTKMYHVSCNQLLLQPQKSISTIACKQWHVKPFISINSTQ